MNHLGASDVIPADQAARVRDFGSDLDEFEVDRYDDVANVRLVEEENSQLLNPQNVSLESIECSSKLVNKLAYSTHEVQGNDTLFLGLSQSPLSR